MNISDVSGSEREQHKDHLLKAASTLGRAVQAPPSSVDQPAILALLEPFWRSRSIAILLMALAAIVAVVNGAESVDAFRGYELWYGAATGGAAAGAVVVGLFARWRYRKNCEWKRSRGAKR